MSKTDELKIYTGKETLQALLEGKTLKSKEYNTEYKMIGEMLHSRKESDWNRTVLSFNVIYEMEFTEVVLPQVGDWVKTCGYIGQITKVDEIYMYAYWSNIPYMETPIFLKHDWEILSPEQVSEYKRELAFSKVGRKLNEFKPEDIVYVESLEKVMVVISKVNTDKVMLREINYTGSGRHAARPHQLTPISFVEDQVDLS